MLSDRSPVQRMAEIVLWYRTGYESPNRHNNFTKDTNFGELREHPRIRITPGQPHATITSPTGWWGKALLLLALLPLSLSFAVSCNINMCLPKFHPLPPTLALVPLPIDPVSSQQESRPTRCWKIPDIPHSNRKRLHLTPSQHQLPTAQCSNQCLLRSASQAPKILRKAIQAGVPLYNSGDTSECFRVYRTAALDAIKVAPHLLANFSRRDEVLQRNTPNLKNKSG